MDLQLDRVFVGSDYTIGKFYVDEVFFCDTLEDVPRKEKIQDKTCIPAGKYKVELTFSNRFQRILPLLLDVPGFTGIRIHPGNDAKDTSGCILVGVNDVKGRVTKSKVTFDRLFSVLEAVDGEIWIDITQKADLLVA